MKIYGSQICLLILKLFPGSNRQNRMLYHLEEHGGPWSVDVKAARGVSKEHSFLERDSKPAGWGPRILQRKDSICTKEINPVVHLQDVKSNIYTKA